MLEREKTRLCVCARATVKFYVGIICDDTTCPWVRKLVFFGFWFYTIMPLEGSIVEVKFDFLTALSCKLYNL